MRRPEFKLKICVSGAAETGHCGIDAFETAKELGREIVKQGNILVTGATVGFPLWAAMGAKAEGGMSIGLSPAASEKEHTEVYRLPLEYMDLIIYTGFGFSGRNLLLTRSADAVVVGCGRIGTINEFTVAYEDSKPIGVLEGSWPTDEVIRNMMEESHRTNNKVIFEKNPKSIVRGLRELIIKDKKHNHVYSNHDGVVGKRGEIIL
jgi:uncharacterized protein (TIGR00725 family)